MKIIRNMIQILFQYHQLIQYRNQLPLIALVNGLRFTIMGNQTGMFILRRNGGF